MAGQITVCVSCIAANHSPANHSPANCPRWAGGAAYMAYLAAGAPGSYSRWLQEAKRNA